MLNFKKYGTGEPLVILHGLYGSSDNWVSIAKRLEAMFTVYLVDLRNHGRSPHYELHNYAVMTDDLVAFLNDQGVYSANIIGHSMGGKLAMTFASLYPEMVRRLVVVDISPRTYAKASGDGQLEEHRAILEALASLDLAQLKKREDADTHLAQYISSFSVRQFLLKNLVRDRSGRFSWRLNIETLKESLESVVIGLENERDDLRRFMNPTLFIRGGSSHYIRDVDLAMIKDFFPHAQIETIKDASHWVHAEQPDAFIHCVVKFLS